MLNKQQIFDKVAIHLLTQKAKALLTHPFDNSVNNCQYRTDTGLKCAIGCLIPDELYNKNIEGKSIYQIDYILKELVAKNVEIMFLDKLQVIHDDLFVEQWPNALINFAIEYQLETDNVIEYTRNF